MSACRVALLRIQGHLSRRFSTTAQNLPAGRAALQRLRCYFQQAVQYYRNGKYVIVYEMSL